MPALMIAATHSGAGKTTATGVLLRALCDRGLSVQAFKHGPDFIDPAYHREITGDPSINLDLELMGSDGVRDSFRQWSAAAQLSVIESMGALYDGTDGTERGSPAALAKLLDVPVLLIIDVWGMTRTAAAVLDGMINFDPDVRIAGCILNRVGGSAHAQMIMDSLPDQLSRMVVGHIVHQPDLEVPERHLGLLTVEENAATADARAQAQRTAAQDLDLDRLIMLCDTRITPSSSPREAMPAPSMRLGIARDAAFCFYYEENLLALRRVGFELVPFSPIHDQQLPEVDAIYLGGGYPESFGAELAANESLIGDLRAAATQQLPIYGECGGLMYLARSLTDFDGVRHQLAGVLPIDVIMDRNHLAIGYAAGGTTLTESPLGKANSPIRGQEFHQSRITSADLEANLFEVTDTTGRSRRTGYQVGSVAASYLHLHFAQTPDLPEAFGSSARQSRSG